VGLKSFEIVTEHLHHPARHFGEFSLAAPSLDGLENVRLGAKHLRRRRKTEVGVGAEIRALQRPVERSRHETPGHPNRHAPPSAELAAGSPDVDEPAIDMMTRATNSRRITIGRGGRTARREAPAFI